MFKRETKVLSSEIMSFQAVMSGTLCVHVLVIDSNYKDESKNVQKSSCP